MKIAILTQSSRLSSIKRLQSAAKKLGHSCKVIETSDVVLEFNGHEKGIFAEGKSITEYDLVIVRSVFKVRKRVIPIIKYLRLQGIRVMDNNLERVGYNIDKLQDTVLFSMNNLPIPKTLNADDESDFVDSCIDLGFPVIIKDSSSGKGNRIYKLEDETEIDALVDTIKEDGKVLKSYLIQRFIPYIKDIRILYINGKIIGAIQRVPKAGDFRANFSKGGDVLYTDIDEETAEIVKKAAKVSETMEAGVDVIIDKDNNKYLLEVNRTPGFEGFEKVHNIDIADLIMQNAIENAY